jgi:hypothetical protein
MHRKTIKCKHVVFSTITCEIWGSHSGDAEDSSLLKCYAVSTGKYVLTFRGKESTRRKYIPEGVEFDTVTSLTGEAWGEIAQDAKTKVALWRLLRIWGSSQRALLSD